MYSVSIYYRTLIREDGSNNNNNIKVSKAHELHWVVKEARGAAGRAVSNLSHEIKVELNNKLSSL